MSNIIVLKHKIYPFRLERVFHSTYMYQKVFQLCNKIFKYTSVQSLLIDLLTLHQIFKAFLGTAAKSLLIFTF